MSDVKKQIVSPLRTNPPQTTVGSTYADRTKYIKTQQGIPTKPLERPIYSDQFDKDPKKINGLDQFDPNAVYKAQRKRFAGAPYKPAILDAHENGTISKRPGQPSDEKILKFLTALIQQKTS